MSPQKDKDGLKPGQFKCYGKTVSPPNTSIHPRVVRGRTLHEKVNTAKPRRKR